MNSGSKSRLTIYGAYFRLSALEMHEAKEMSIERSTELSVYSQTKSVISINFFHVLINQ